MTGTSGPPAELDVARLERLSVLQELTVAALELFEPERSVNLFLERLAERLSCTAGLWLVVSPAGVALLGFAGISRSSALAPIAARGGDLLDWSRLQLPYPELASPQTRRWVFDLGTTEGSTTRHCLLLFFERDEPLLLPFKPMIERLTRVLRTAVSHRRLVENLRASNEALARSQAALLQKERLAALGELSAVVAHEVRNPLGAILNSVASLERHGSHPEEQTGLLGIVREEAEQIDRIVSDLLDFAKPRAMSLRPEVAEQVVASGIEAARRGQVSPAAVEVVLEVRSQLPKVTLDAERVREAIINLVTNARQAAAPGGHVRVTLSEATREARRMLRIDVTDDGPGVAPELRERIFEPFFSTRASGTGLGLPIVKRIVEDHGGRLEVQPPTPRETTFTVWLPL